MKATLGVMEFHQTVPLFVESKMDEHSCQRCKSFTYRRNFSFRHEAELSKLIERFELKPTGEKQEEKHAQANCEKRFYKCLQCNQEYLLQIELAENTDLKRARLEKTDNASDRPSPQASAQRTRYSPPAKQNFPVANTPDEINLAKLADNNSPNLKKIAALLDSGVNPNLRLPRNGALVFHSFESTEILELFCRAGVSVDEPDDIGRTRLLISASKANADQVRILIRNGANPNYLLNTFGSAEKHPYERDLYEIPILQALSLVRTDDAIRKRTVATVRVLLAGGANPNVKYEHHQSARYRGKSAQDLVIEANLRSLFSDFSITEADSRVVKQNKDLAHYRHLALEAIALGGQWRHGVGDRESQIRWRSQGTVIHREERDLLGPYSVCSSKDHKTPEETLRNMLLMQASHRWDRSEHELELIRDIATQLQRSIE